MAAVSIVKTLASTFVIINCWLVANTKESFLINFEMLSEYIIEIFHVKMLLGVVSA